MANRLHRMRVMMGPQVTAEAVDILEAKHPNPLGTEGNPGRQAEPAKMSFSDAVDQRESHAGVVDMP